ncbi:unconventional myosin-X [Erinaceus europaeus]|uniref:Unconventional myosin-X n=1 Tax=Erinaceus europaeus TaxID=9365 RepID=A0ABM3XGG8_ERIEU|nr:unconventional myosin-X [Erinaceus europaeus]
MDNFFPEIRRGTRALAAQLWRMSLLGLEPGLSGLQIQCSGPLSSPWGPPSFYFSALDWLPGKFKGARVWLRENGQHFPSTVSSCAEGVVVFRTDYGQVFTYKQSTITHQKVTAMHPMNEEGVDDMAALAELHGGAIMHNLYQRYTRSQIYTYIGSIIASVNPYKPIGGLYERATMERYSRCHLGELPPHIFAVANECYRCLWRRHDNQCVLISGESGAGKTESTKLILKFLSAISQQSLELTLKEQTSCVEQAILESSPIMEAFGNAKTVYNNNSSRFGKFVQLNICQKGNIQGGKIVDYLLEKNRVVRQNPGERNYHIFYALLAGLEHKEREEFYLSVPEDYHYLNQSGCVKDKTISDQESFQEVTAAMEVMQFSKEEVREVLRLLAGILHLGNIEFITAGGAQVSFKTALVRSAELLGLEPAQLTDALTQRSMFLRGEEILTPLNVQQAADSRDSLAMALYARCFAWVIKKINSRIKGKDDFKSIGILDIFGFENFEVNHFEQFNINYANEKLQEYFNKHIFSLEQLEYSREGLVWEDIDWVDNGECLDLIEKKLGLLALINEESHFPQATDSTLLEKLHNQHANNHFYVKPRVAVNNFGVKHYAGEVQYDVRGILEKNRDTFRDDLLNLLRESRFDFIYDLFEHVSSRNNQDTLKCGSKHRRPTVSSQFKDSLHSLMATLSNSNPFFVRCIKPNTQKMPDHFDQAVVLNQLRYSGMLETVRIRKAGYAVRRPFQDFYKRYRVLMRKEAVPEDIRGKCTALLQLYDASHSEWQLGKTKVFLRESLEQKLEKHREEEVTRAAMVIRAHILGYLARKQYRKVLLGVVTIQKNYRAFILRRRFLCLRKAALVFQKQLRGQRARRAYRQLLAEKQAEEEKRRREEEKRRKEEEKQRQEEEKRRQEEEEQRKREQTQKEVELQARQEAAAEKQREDQQVEAILRLEREIEDLQRRKERQELSLSETELRRLQELRDLELRRLEDEACRAAHDFLASLNFHEIDQCVRDIERSLAAGAGNCSRPGGLGQGRRGAHGQREEDDEVDEGFGGADDEAFKDSPNPSEHGHSDQRTSGIRTSDESSEEDPYMNDTLAPASPDSTLLLAASPSASPPSSSSSSAGDRTYCVPQHPGDPPAPQDDDAPGDYDYGDYAPPGEDSADGPSTAGGSVALSHSGCGQWSPDYRCSVGTYTSSSGAYRFSSEGAQSSFEDSEEDFDARFDTDDELSYRRDSVYSCVTLPYFHSFLYMKGGLMNSWKRRWCVLKDETFLWFRSKQEALKQGWLHKKGGGSSTLSRRNWKKRWFVLRQSKLMYFENDSEDRLKGALEVRTAKEIIDNTSKENGIDIVMADRTFHLIAESPEDASQWFSVLSQVHASTDQEIREMHDEQANPQNAVGTLDVGLIDSVCASDSPDRPNSFVIITANRVLHCNADTPEEMHHWITLLQRSKGDTRVEGQEFIVRGWLHKEVKNNPKMSSLKLKKRWFVLTHNSLDYYKSSEKNALKLGTLVLNSLCSVVPPDEKIFKETGERGRRCGDSRDPQPQNSERARVRFLPRLPLMTSVPPPPPPKSCGHVLFRGCPRFSRRFFLFICLFVYSFIFPFVALVLREGEREREIWRQGNKIRSHVRNSPCAPARMLPSACFLPLMASLCIFKENCLNLDVVEQIYKRNPILRHTHHPLHSPLLPLPYGDINLNLLKDKGYTTLQDEAIKIFNSLQQLESVSDPVPIIQGILQTGHDLRPLRDELYCQLIKQTTKVPQPGSAGNLYSWQILTCLSCTFLPSRGILKYLKFHLRRIREQFPGTEMEKYALFTYESLKRTKCREFVPSRDEIEALIQRQEMTSTVYCHGGGSCKITINSHTTAGEVVEKLIRGLAMEDSRNMFALFEYNGHIDKAIESRTIVADVLAKFEKLAASSEGAELPWKFYFKLYCFLDTDNVPKDSVEFAFMFEQAHEAVIHGHYPAPEENLQVLAALRLQYLQGDYTLHATLLPLEEVYCLQRLRARISQSTKSFSPCERLEKRRTSFLEGTLRRSFRTGSMVRQKAEEEQMLDMWIKEEVCSVRASIIDKWKKFQGMSQEQAMAKYMTLIKDWPGYGSTLFDVECKEGGFPQELWLGVSADAVSVYKRGEGRPLEVFQYEHILSFGAPLANTYKIVVDERELLFETSEVVDVAKLMKAYISMIVKKRYSTSRSVSSQGSSR